MARHAKTNLKDLSLEDFEELVLRLGRKAFTGRQLFKWIFRAGIDDFSAMTDLSRDLRDALAKNCQVKKLEAARIFKSHDGTSKTVWDAGAGVFIESVLIPDDGRLTLCLSSQAGCAIGCEFCATGRNGFIRNLTSGEIYDQFLLTARTRPTANITNIVFMGMGEPLLNYRNVLQACAALTSQYGAGFSARKITISTVGLVNGIYKLAEDNPSLNLAISLHSAIEDKRKRLIPIASKSSLEELKNAAVHYARKSRRRITFEYLLIRDTNDSIADARALAEFAKGIPCKINLIGYNEVPGAPFAAPDEATLLAFRDYLYPRAPAVTLRLSKGSDIAAACGQLAGMRQR